MGQRDVPREMTSLGPLASISCGRPTPSSTLPEDPRGDSSHASAIPHKIADPEIAKLPDGPPPPPPELPPPPIYSDSEVPDRYEDGAWSIRGLRNEFDERVKEGEAGTEVEVLAWLQEVYVAPTCPAQGSCPPAKQPHLWVTDEPDERGKRHALLVANYYFSIPEFDAKRWKGQPEVVMETGKRYRMRGRFKRFSDTGFAHDRGLFEFIAVEVIDERGKKSWVYPPGAPWHPIEVERQRQADAQRNRRP